MAQKPSLEVGNVRHTFYTDVNRTLILDLTKSLKSLSYNHRNFTTAILYLSKSSVDEFIFKLFKKYICLHKNIISITFNLH